jgi:hypothetical protein
MSRLPFAHYTATAITPAGASSLQNFLNNLHAINLFINRVDVSLIRLMIIPQDPLSVPYFFFISYAKVFSFVFSSRYCSSFFFICW